MRNLLWNTLAASIVLASGIAVRAQSAGVDSVPLVEDVAPSWDQDWLWSWTVPSASPRPGASIAGPMRVEGVVSINLAHLAEGEHREYASRQKTTQLASEISPVQTPEHQGDSQTGRKLWSLEKRRLDVRIK